MSIHDKEAELFRDDELPVPIAFPLTNDLGRDHPENELSFSGQDHAASFPEKPEEP